MILKNILNKIKFWEEALTAIKAEITQEEIDENLHIENPYEADENDEEWIDKVNS